MVVMNIIHRIIIMALNRLLLLIYIMKRLLSYNVRGLNSSTDYVKESIDEMQPDILYLQETWHLENVLEHLSQVSDDDMFIKKSGVDSKHAILGRPYGGLDIFYRKSLADRISVRE